MTCLTPNISSAYVGNKTDTTVMLGFKMANIINLLMFRNITVVSDPVFYPFTDNVKLHDFTNLDLMITVRYLSLSLYIYIYIINYKLLFSLK